MGQCFSSTVPGMVLTPKSKVIDEQSCRWGELADVERGGYVFSDGIGTASPLVFRRIARKLGLSRSPSAMQIRLAGVKGMLSLDTRLSGWVVNTRPSMDKFASESGELDVCETSSWLVGRLSRQTITLLSTRGVPDLAFEELLDREMRALQASAQYDQDGSGVRRVPGDALGFVQLLRSLGETCPSGFRYFVVVRFEN